MTPCGFNGGLRACRQDGGYLLKVQVLMFRVWSGWCLEPRQTKVMPLSDRCRKVHKSNLNSTSNEHTQDGNVRSTSGEGHTTLGAGGLVDAAFVVFADSGPGCRVDIAGTRSQGGQSLGLLFPVLLRGSESVPGRLSRSEILSDGAHPGCQPMTAGASSAAMGPASAASESDRDIKYQQREPLDCQLVQLRLPSES